MPRGNPTLGHQICSWAMVTSDRLRGAFHTSFEMFFACWRRNFSSASWLQSGASRTPSERRPCDGSSRCMVTSPRSSSVKIRSSPGASAIVSM